MAGNAGQGENAGGAEAVPRGDRMSVPPAQEVCQAVGANACGGRLQAGTRGKIGRNEGKDLPVGRELGRNEGQDLPLSRARCACC